MMIMWKIVSVCIVLLSSTVFCGILRCDLIDPHSRESEICWHQLLYKSYPQMSQIQETSPDSPVPVHARNAELSSALMQLYGFNKFNGKRNPDFSRDMMKYMTDVSPYKEN